MAKVKRAGRVSLARMQPAQKTREQKILAMIATGGLSNDEIWDAFESQMPQIIRPDDPRRVAGLIDTPYDKEERERFGRALRSTRGLAQKAAGDSQELLDVLGHGDTRPAYTVDYENVKRFSSGDPDMDDLYGKTEYVYLIPPELRGKPNSATGETWEYGDPIPKKYHRFLDPMTGLPSEEPIDAKIDPHVAYGDKTGYAEVGIPSEWVSTWGGMRGVGKSRLAIAVEKSTCLMHEGRTVLHNYGESNMAQLRGWIGPKAPKNLIIGERKSLAQILDDLYKYKPILYVQDSLQTVLDAQTARGMKEVLATLKQVATEEAAGKPHIIVISQLNKKGDLRGSSELGHLVDFVAMIKKRETQRNRFFFWVDKNRGGETDRSVDYLHNGPAIVSMGPGSRNKPKIQLRGANEPAIVAGVANPEVLPDDGGDDL